jgi:integrase
MVQESTSVGGSLMSGSMGKPTLPQRAGSLPVRELIDLYMAHYEGRDPTRVQRLGWWSTRIGHLEMRALCDDDIHAALEALAQQRSRFFAGKDIDGAPIYKPKQKSIAPATVNRYAASLAAVVTWAIKRRIAPKGYVHPCRSVERERENNEKTRFLSDDERERLLAACKASPWPRLYALALMALTTGARKGELLGLTWADIDEDRGLALVGRSKNGDPKFLPIVPTVRAELARFRSVPTHRVFPSTRRPHDPYSFEIRWKEALHAAHVRNFRFHDLRHSCASMLAQSGATLLEIADLLGHRQLQMTKRYSHLATGHKSALVNRVLGGIK